MKKLLTLFISSIIFFSLSCFDVSSGKNNSNYIDKQRVQLIERIKKESLLITVTAYSPTKEECDDDPFTTAFQKPVRKGIIAVSRDLEDKYGWKEGDKIYIVDLGVFEVGDRMNKRWKKRVDIFFFKTSEAKKFGKKNKKLAIKLNV